MSSTKRKAPPVRIAQPQTTRNAKPMAKARINEAKTTVVSVPKHTKSKKKAAGEAIEISSDEEEAEGVEDDADLMDEDEDEPEVATEQKEEALTNGHVNGTKKSADAENDDNEEDDDADHEPTFGDLVREHETVDVTAALSQLNPEAAEAAQNENGAAAKSTAAPTLSSLGHLLNAALRSGDDANLEVCFNTTTDAVWVRNTIQRLDPSLAGTLLQKLATRIHRRPGRAHTLVGWVQWTLITHGGALLANQAGVTRALQELHRVLEERARGLNSLLLLKGKLDMLEAQMQLRRLQRQGASANTPNGHSGIATVGGRAGGSSKALDGVGSVSRRGAGRRRGGRGARGGDEDEDEFVATYHEEDDVSDDEDEAGQILVNGAGIAGESFIADSDEEALDEDDDEDSEGDDDEDAEDEDDVEDMDEDDVAEEDEVDFDDVDDEDDDDDEDDEDDTAAAPPPKLQKKSGGAFSKRR